MTLKPVDTAIIMVVGPCIDDTDLKSLEESIAYNAAGMDISLIVEKTDGTSAVTAITLTTGGTSDWTHKDGGYYEVEITAAQNAEEGVAYVRGVCTGVLPFESVHYDIVKANIYDSLIKGTDVLHADVTQWIGTAAATPTVAGVPEVDITYCGGSAVAAGAIPNAAADAAGGLPVSDAGNLDLDTKLANTNEITAARMGALTDWMNGGRLDNILDARAPSSTALSNATWTDAKADFLNAAISGRAPSGEYDTQMGYIPANLGDVPIASELNSAHGAGSWATATGFSTHAAADIWSVGTRALTDKAGFSLSTAGIKAVWDQATNVLTTVGSIGKLLVDNIDATISSRNATTPPTVAAIRTEMEGAGTKLTLTLEDTGTTIPGTITALQTDVTAIDVLTEGGGSGDLAAIKTQVDAILDLERESGVVTVTNVETTLYEDAAPTKNKMGVVVKVDMAALASGDTFVVKEKYKDESGGAYQEVDSVSYTGAQTKPLRIITLTPYRYGAIITMQRTAGVNRSIEWESFMGE